MYHLLIKNFNKVGSIVYWTDDLNEIKALENLLYSKIGNEEIQIVVLSSLETWKEYEPFTYVKSHRELLAKVY